jgi:hypothetical protein
MLQALLKQTSQPVIEVTWEMIKDQFPHFSLEPRGSDRAVQYDETSLCVAGTQTRQKFISDE